MILSMPPAIPHGLVRVFGALACFLATQALADDDAVNGVGLLERWSLSGSIRNHGEYRDSSGALAAGIFGQNKLDGYSELDLRFARAFNPYFTLDGSFFGAADSSEFRGHRETVTPERFRLAVQRGDMALPWKAEFGDYFGFTSIRTLQTPVKGARIEVQSPHGRDGWFHSGQLFAGNRAFDYNTFLGQQFDDNVFAGYSHLVETPGIGSYIFSAIYNTQDGPTRKNIESGVASIASEHTVRLGGHQVTAEAEAAFMIGETATGARISDSRAAGLFSQINGITNSNWRYSGRFEQYDRAFRPAGAAITSDRRLFEARLGKRFDSGLDLEARYQHFDDARSTTNPFDLDTAGVLASWPELISGFGLSGFFDGFWRQNYSRDRTIENVSFSGDLVFNWSVFEDITATSKLFAQILDDQSATDTDRQTLQLELSATKPVTYDLWGGSLSPGIVLRLDEIGPQNVLAIGPRLGADIYSSSGHSLSANGAVLFQDGSNGAFDTVDLNGGLRYAYTSGQHTLGLELDYFSNDPSPGEQGESYRIAANYTFRFNRPARTEASAEPGTLPATTPGASRLASYSGGTLFAKGFPDLAKFKVGSSSARAVGLLSASGQKPGSRFADNLVYGGRFLRNIGQRQRLVLSERAGDLNRVTLIVDFVDPRDTGASQRTFAKVLERLIQHYGTPDRSLDTGVFEGDLAANIAIGRFRRTSEWTLANGVLRFGIPRRHDNAVRMELQFARNHSNIGQPLWSLQAIR